MKKQYKNEVTLNEVLGIAPPNDIELEKTLLGAILSMPDTLPDIDSIISEKSFYSDIHSDIWVSIKDTYDTGKTVNIITVFQRSQKLNKNIEAYYLSSLITGFTIVSKKQIFELALFVKELELKRMCMQLSFDIQTSLAQKLDVNDIKTNIEETLNNIVNGSILNGNTKRIDEVLIESEFQLSERMKNKGSNGIKSGITGLDAMLGGFKKCELIVIGARPGMGKTATLLKFIENAALTDNKCAIFSLEMESTRLADRLTIAKSGVNSDKYRHGFLDSIELDKVKMANMQIANYKIWIDDKAGVNVNYIKSVSRKLYKNNGLGMIAIDYLQLVETNSDDKFNREQEVAKISRSLKLLAKELSIPVILLAQLNRQVETRSDKRPQLNDLRESGAIEQDADVVIFINRPFVYSRQDEDRNKMTYIVAKQREGSTGDVDCYCNESLTYIVDEKDYETELSLMQTPEFSQENLFVNGLHDFQ